MNLRLFALALTLASTALRGAPLERDLGQGLAYCRVHALPADLPAPPAVRHPWVIDVRYVGGGSAEGAALLAWLKAEAGPRSPIFLLANAETSDAVLAPLNPADAVAGLVIIGPGSADFRPDISLPLDSSEERRAYDALEKGASVDSLISENQDKPRDDEAKLARDRLPDNGPSDDPPKPASAEQAAKPPPLIDAALQRAIQLHRGLVALKRL